MTFINDIEETKSGNDIVEGEEKGGGVPVGGESLR
jgi:hypothetical protein